MVNLSYIYIYDAKIEREELVKNTLRDNGGKIFSDFRTSKRLMKPHKKKMLPFGIFLLQFHQSFLEFLIFQ